MKKIFVLFFILTALNISAGDFSLKFNEIENEFYKSIVGVWDDEFMKDIEGTPRLFSWGMGEHVKNDSILIDYNLYDDNSWGFKNLSPYEITYIDKLEDNLYKLKLYYEYRNKKGIILIHIVEDGIIWFETESQYKFNLGEVDSADISYGEQAYYNGDMLTGPENLYYRRSGPNI